MTVLDEADQKACEKCGRGFPVEELEDCWGCSRIFCHNCINNHDCTPEEVEQ